MYAIGAAAVGGAMAFAVAMTRTPGVLAGAALLTIPVVLFQGQDVMTDYVPLLDTPLFFTGFVTFLAGIGAADFLAAVARQRVGATLAVAHDRAGVAGAGASPAPTTALAALGLAAPRLGIGAAGRPVAEYYQAMFWGMGRSFQLGAGELGAPRKTYDAAVVGAAWLKPMVLVGLGAAVAVLGGVLFVAVLLLSLLRKPVAQPETRPVAAMLPQGTEAGD